VAKKYLLSILNGEFEGRQAEAAINDWDFGGLLLTKTTGARRWGNTSSKPS